MYTHIIICIYIYIYIERERDNTNDDENDDNKGSGPRTCSRTASSARTAWFGGTPMHCVWGPCANPARSQIRLSRTDGAGPWSFYVRMLMGGLPTGGRPGSHCRPVYPRTACFSVGWVSRRCYAKSLFTNVCCCCKCTLFNDLCVSGLSRNSYSIHLHMKY